MFIVKNQQNTFGTSPKHIDMQTFKYEKLLILINLIVEILFLIYFFFASPNILISLKSIYVLVLILSILFLTVSLILRSSKRILSLKISAIFAILGGALSLPLGGIGFAAGVSMFKNINIVSGKEVDKKHFIRVIIVWIALIIFLISVNFLINRISYNNKILSVSDKVYSTLQNGETKNIYTKDEVTFLVKNIRDCGGNNKDLVTTNPEKYINDFVICINKTSNSRQYSLQELFKIVNIINNNLTK